MRTHRILVYNIYLYSFWPILLYVYAIFTQSLAVQMVLSLLIGSIQIILFCVGLLLFFINRFSIVTILGYIVSSYLGNIWAHGFILDTWNELGMIDINNMLPTIMFVNMVGILMSMLPLCVIWLMSRE